MSKDEKSGRKRRYKEVKMKGVEGKGGIKE